MTPDKDVVAPDGSSWRIHYVANDKAMFWSERPELTRSDGVRVTHGHGGWKHNRNMRIEMFGKSGEFSVDRHDAAGMVNGMMTFVAGPNYRVDLSGCFSRMPVSTSYDHTELRDVALAIAGALMVWPKPRIYVPEVETVTFRNWTGGDGGSGMVVRRTPCE